MEQETSYEMEVIICDDGSEDGTMDVIKDLCSKYPGIVVVRSEQAQGPLKSGQRFFKTAQGIYLCWMDADDCWTYKGKLQHQIDFLEANTGYAGCFHDATIVSRKPEGNNTDEYKMRFHGSWKTYSQFNLYHEDFFPWDALMRRIIPTASLIFRRTDMNPFFEQFSDHHLSISWAVHLWLLKNGKFRYFNETWSEYLDHAEGFSKKYRLADFKINNISILEKLLADDYYRHLEKDMYAALAREYFHLLSLPDVGHLKKSTFQKYLKAYRKYSGLHGKTEVRYFQEQYKSGKKSKKI
jgi:glycosyltransferase involved in cell wall biosynthesis